MANLTKEDFLKLKIGDQIEAMQNPESNCYNSGTNPPKSIHVKAMITGLDRETNTILFTLDAVPEYGLPATNCAHRYDDIRTGAFGGPIFRLINKTNNNQSTMNLKEKFLLALKSEPEKSFRRLGITNGDDMLTTEGTELFLNFLFEKNKTEFKKEVVDSIIAEEEKAKK